MLLKYKKTNEKLYTHIYIKFNIKMTIIHLEVLEQYV